MSKYSTHPATNKIKNQWATKQKDRRPSLEQLDREKQAKRLRKKRKKGR